MKTKTLEIKKIKTEELILRVLYPTKEYSKKTIEEYKIELKKREVTPKRLHKINLTWTNKDNKQRFKEKIKIELEKSESYTFTEMIILLIVGPIYFFKPNLSSFKSLGELKNEGAYIKFKQKILLIICGTIIQVFFGIYYFRKTYS